ncbi:MAG: hypothetical protein A2408_03900 [Candidatus Yonathbacteria bacterium RIFOXYC1_FULL_52_10]|uniref:Glycosyltransferase 2-like domain-containing protein n=1 Tax=Candidatus Yonathbacteria bacterium RIFOXYD1_FULL_52_36 TaxID=1802730 RepID=A0A1G2SIB2_9BACT|nr:MAG: hypothetical protein A2408_03900 [Candidatus Yonathbacteria bacterium RIFOXYC1_FULL_52_10]OHA84740.1 MAG: hypothetical protein A2591_03415 [Candidatus Yonathbacteria bacterium RIFOXYD1_FULL_52_36]
MKFESVRTPDWLAALYIGSILVYAFWWLDFSHVGSWVLYGVLLAAEVYHIWQALGYLFTVWGTKDIPVPEPTQYPPVDVFITVCGEPRAIVEETLRAALAMDYPSFEVHLLNDGFVAKKDNWEDIVELGAAYNVNVITRQTPGGAKAGNTNNALKYTSAPFFVLFDADHVPHVDFLQRTIGYMDDPKMAIVQTPQYYANRDENFITRAAWEQQELFFGPICQGKARMNATFWCGTNALIRREALLSIGGVPEQSIAEDFLASLFIHQRGWKSTYVPEVLAHGLAPADLESYTLQQYRWARGSLDVLFRYNPLFLKGLEWRQRLQYLYSASFYLNGLVVLADALIPLFFLFFGTIPVQDTTGGFIIFFSPFIFFTLYLLMRSTRYTITFRAIQLTVAASFIFIIAFMGALIGKRAKFTVTSKEQRKEANFIYYALPNIAYVVLVVLSMIVAVDRDGLTPAVVTNASWAVFNIVFFWPYIHYAYPWHLVPGRMREYMRGAFSTPAPIGRKTYPD